MRNFDVVHHIIPDYSYTKENWVLLSICIHKMEIWILLWEQFSLQVHMDINKDYSKGEMQAVWDGSHSAFRTQKA